MAYGVSKASQYAIRALVSIADTFGGDAMPVRSISESEGIPQHFLAKLIPTLVRNGLVEAFKGPGGGLRLARSPHDVPLSEVIESIDGPDFFEGCFLGFGECGDENPCPMHEVWRELRPRLRDDLSRVTIGALAKLAESSVGKNGVSGEGRR